jgi:hypothetical protein
MGIPPDDLGHLTLAQIVEHLNHYYARAER